MSNDEGYHNIRTILINFIQEYSNINLLYYFIFYNFQKIFKI